MSCNHYPPFGVCTGHGVCSDNDLCKCDDGWSSIGDFSTKEGDHCGINVNAIRVLWSIAFIPFLYLFYLCAKLIRIRIKNIKQASQVSNQNNMSNLKPKHLSWKEPIAIFPIFFLVSSISALIFTILKVINPIKFSIALDPLTTTLLYFFCVSATYAGSVYLLLLLNFLEGYAKMMSSKAGQYIKNQSGVVQLVVKAIILSAPLLLASPFFNIANPGHERECMIAFALGVVIILTLLGTSLLRYLSIMSTEIKKHLDSNNKINNNDNESVNSSNNNHKNSVEKFVSIMNKIDKAWMALFSATLFIIVQLSLFIFWPFLTKMSSYFFPLLMLAVGIVGIIFDKSIMHEAKIKRVSKRSSTSNTNTGNQNDNAVIPIAATGNSFEMSKPTPQTSEAEVTEIQD